MLFQIESLLNDINSLKASAHGAVINIKPSFQSMYLMFRWGQICIAFSQSKQRNTIKA
ncbi:hypothetical protein VCRA2117O37_640001 [Vibrio crassostreae]|nr:hypothetical protein VCRA2116O31_290001 [Vibrio crassostreae]CAK2159113.1 hypothetical protein VCRA2117O37_640001 [Vibrio crassostreae]CAK2215561.1 hypothetical protein VCRA2113O119_710002 [Vibrio crassostreae]CAK2367556.1 hypothetical protein VCRA2119O51_580002 [Vibrio crassostreae]CAK3046744.1 hypothetical protein VCRA2119O124_650001 [Vibrio crassostreae]